MCSLLSSVVMVAFTLRIVTLIQLDGYNAKLTDKIKQILSKQWFSAVAVGLYMYIIYLVSILADMPSFQHFIALLTLLTCLYQTASISSIDCRQQLVCTPRLVRWQSIYFVCLFVLFFIAYLAGSWITIGEVKLIYLFLPICILLNWYILKLSLFIDYPIEKIVHNHYIKQAKSKLQSMPNLVVIGVTGSCGKTSVKNYLTTILSPYYKVFCTPLNYNTPMGICKSVNMMADDTQIFVVEMGARKLGDIQELCDIVKPQYAILTNICAQHLESFGSIQNIIDTKCEMLDYVENKSNCIVGQNDYMRDMQAKTKDCLIVGDDGFCTAKNIRCSASGSSFDMCIGKEKTTVCTSLIGKHNIFNILLASACAYRLGLNMAQISSQIAQLKQVEHRLQVIENGGVTIIDDSYNSNVVGAKIAIDTLSMFDGEKIVMTQGVVELGKSQSSQNIELGEHIAGVADKCIVLGVNANDLWQGMLDGGMSRRDIFLVKNLEQGQQVLSQIVKNGSVVLIQNDLTDNY